MIVAVAKTTINVNLSVIAVFTMMSEIAQRQISLFGLDLPFSRFYLTANSGGRQGFAVGGVKQPALLCLKKKGTIAIMRQSFFYII